MPGGKGFIVRVLVYLALCIPVASADTDQGNLSDQQDKLVKSLSFIYAPILGTGYYKAGAEKAFVLKLGLDILLNDRNSDQPYRWLLPVTLGVRKTDFDTILENGLPDQLHSIGIMPGLAFDFRPRADWLVVPSIQVGAARDFNIDTSAVIYSANLRALGRWKLSQNTLSWGNRVRLAGQYNLDRRKEQGFVLVETGLDLELEPSVSIAGEKASLSFYTQLQAYIPDIGIRGISGERIDTRTLLHLGISLGFIEKKKILGIPLERGGISFIRGNDLKAISLNLGFPLARD